MNKTFKSEFLKYHKLLTKIKIKFFTKNLKNLKIGNKL